MTGRWRRLISREATGKFSSPAPLPDRSSPLWVIAGSSHRRERVPSTCPPPPAQTDKRKHACNKRIEKQTTARQKHTHEKDNKTAEMARTTSPSHTRQS